jgi:hypothetical protein
LLDLGTELMNFVAVSVSYVLHVPRLQSVGAAQLPSAGERGAECPGPRLDDVITCCAANSAMQCVE